MNSFIGQTVSHYKILEKVGEGGMGVVYKAEDTRLERPVALKFLPSNLTGDKSSNERFIHEARAASAIDHPNICTVYEIDETQDGQMFIVMAYYEGDTLKKEIERGIEDCNRAVDIAIQLSDALALAHQKGIIHRDIKPGNILMTKGGQAKIVDFGLAKLTGQARMTMTGTTMGTTAYMSPEQLRGEQVDHRSDIWSLGVVLYEMITGNLPFHAEFSEAIAYQILNEVPKPATPCRGEIPPGLQRIIQKCLEKDRELRYQSFEEILADFSRLRGTPVGWRLAWSMARSRLWSSWVTKAAAAALIIVAALVGISRLFPGAETAIDSIAVLPLENLSATADQDYLADGLHEALISDLARLSGFRRVIARSSVKRFKNTMLSPRRIADELGVRAILTGTVLCSGSDIRITAHLIDGVTENTIWSERYDRTFKDLLSLEKEIVEGLTREIQLRLTQKEQTGLRVPRAVNPEAYEAYLQGAFYWRKQTRRVPNRSSGRPLKLIPTLLMGISSTQIFSSRSGGPGNGRWKVSARLNLTRWMTSRDVFTAGT